MEFIRGDISTTSPGEFQRLIQATEDRIFGLEYLGFNDVESGGCLPQEARCSDPHTGQIGASSLPGYYELLKRAIMYSVSKVENKIKLALYPRIKTDFPRSPREAYEEKEVFASGSTDSFLTPRSRTFPTWSDLTEEQQEMFNGDQTLYTDGTLPWDLMTEEQHKVLTSSIVFYPNKVDDAERIDGRGRSYIKLYERYITKIHKLELRLQDPQGLGIPYLARTYSPSEYFLYKKSGALILYPAQARISSLMTANMMGAAGYGMIVPALPQILHVSYTYGLEQIPQDLQSAVALYAAVHLFELVNIVLTKGMSSYSVQGFSASFGDGLYRPVIERYTQEAEDLLHSYFQITMIGW